MIRSLPDIAAGFCNVVGRLLRRMPRVVGLAVALVLIAGCGDKSSVREVVIYTSVDQVYSEPILKAYEEKTGVRVRAAYDVEAAKTTGLVTRLESEKSRPQADVFWNGEFAQTIGLKDKGVLLPYRSPAATDIPAGFKDPDGYWASMGGRARVFIVNTTRLKPADYPASLDDLLDPRWPADSIGIANPLFGTMATQAAALYATLGPAPALAFFKALHARGVRVVDGNAVVRDMVAGGQLAFGLTDTDDAVGAIRRGAPVKIIAPDRDRGGTLVIPGTVALIAGAPHPAEAKALIDYLLSAETEAVLIRSGGCQTSVRPESTVGDPAFVGIRAMAVSLHEVQAALPRALAELREIFVR